MFTVPAGQLILGQAKVIVQNHDELVPRVTVCNMVMTDNRVIRWLKSLWRKFIRLYGVAAITMLGAHLASTQIGFDPIRHMPMVMGAITSAISSSFKTDLGVLIHDFTTSTGHTVRTALYTSSATIGASTTQYSATNEITGTGYTAGGVSMANVTPVLSGTTAIYDWADAQWTSSTFTANGSLTYNDTSTNNRSIFSIAFGSDQTVTAGTFTIQWPTADASNAIIRLA